MTTLTEKLAALPPNIVQEVDDFVDFLLIKHRPVITDVTLTEIGMDEYVHTLEQYETMLAEGKVQW
jgi:hypothetical protein